MKTYIAAIALALTASPAMATVTPPPTLHDLCASIGEMARQTMQLRATGAPAHEVVEDVVEFVKWNYGLDMPEEIAASIVSFAYEYPVYQNQYSRVEIVEEFASGAYLGCMNDPSDS